RPRLAGRWSHFQHQKQRRREMQRDWGGSPRSGEGRRARKTKKRRRSIQSCRR
ncbi:unnamed protein product, partial [Ectocarpus sp. 12 AP-2014]